MDYKKLADLLFPKIDKDIDYYLAKFPKRNLPQGALVTRIAPSPTGFLHIGTIFQAVVDKKLADGTGGIYILRLEDTDQKREVEKAGQIAYDMLCQYGLKPDEGYMGDNLPQVGNYGSYKQSERLEIYHTFAKHLVKIGRAFPCFCEKSESKQDILERREQQIEENEEISQRDICRNLSFEEIQENIKKGKPFAIRFKSEGNAENTFKFVDGAKGERILRENQKDSVLLKSDGFPPYELAHIVDDTLMDVNAVVRGEEYVPSLSRHLELFAAFGFKPPKYFHNPVISKIDADGNKRKISKRKDPEADARYFFQKGYTVDAIMEYVLNLLNSNFEDWRRQNPDLHYSKFPFSASKIGSNNPLFDFAKLDDMSKNVVAKISAADIYDSTLVWAKENDKTFYDIIKDKKDFCIELFSIDRDGPKPRKDIAKWSDIPKLYPYMFKELFNHDITEYNFDASVSANDIKAVLKKYLEVYNPSDDKQQWFLSVKSICEPLGFCADMKEYKNKPEKYKGSVATISGIIRTAITKWQASPDLCSIMKLLGKDEVRTRIDFVLENLK